MLCFFVMALLATRPVLWLCCLLKLLLLLVWMPSALTSGLAVVSDRVMPLVWSFVSSWPSLASGVAVDALWFDLSCMADAVSHLCFGRCFLLGCFILYDCRWLSLLVWPSFRLARCLSFGRFLSAPSFGVSAPPSMLEAGCVVLSAVGLLVVLPWLVWRYRPGISSWDFLPVLLLALRRL